MHLKAVGRSIAPLQIMLWIAMFLTSGIALYYQENPWPLFLGWFGAFVFGMGLFLLCKGVNLKHSIRIKEGFAITTFSWILAVLFGALPFYFYHFFDSQISIGFTDSFFESMSGFTTTGASVLSHLENFPKALLFWRSLTHWFGGMGIIVIGLAIFPQLAIGGMQMFQSEAPGPFKNDKIMPRIKDTILILWKVYLLFTVLEFLILWLVGLNWFDALIHTFGTIATGGFSNYDTSVSGLNNQVAAVVIAIFMILAGVNFSLYFAFFKGKIQAIFDRELLVYLALIVGGIILVSANLYAYHVYPTLRETIREAFFQVPAILSTTGYTTSNFDVWPPFSKALLWIMMFVGGSAGSTAGGFKIVRYIVLFKYIVQEVKRKLNPHIVSTIRIAQKPLDDSVLNSIIAFAGVYIILFVFGGIVLTAYGVNVVTSFSASIASLGNIGPWFGWISPLGNYAFLPQGAKWILCFLMLAGRLEVFTLLILFLPEMWRNTKKWGF